MSNPTLHIESYNSKKIIKIVKNIKKHLTKKYSYVDKNSISNENI